MPGSQPKQVVPPECPPQKASAPPKTYSPYPRKKDSCWEKPFLTMVIKDIMLAYLRYSSYKYYEYVNIYLYIYIHICFLCSCLLNQLSTILVLVAPWIFAGRAT